MLFPVDIEVLDNVKNHSAAQANVRFASPDFAARMHFIVIGRISIKQRLIPCFRIQAYRLSPRNATLDISDVIVSLKSLSANKNVRSENHFF